MLKLSKIRRRTPRLDSATERNGFWESRRPVCTESRGNQSTHVVLGVRAPKWTNGHAIMRSYLNLSEKVLESRNTLRANVIIQWGIGSGQKLNALRRSCHTGLFFSWLLTPERGRVVKAISNQDSRWAKAAAESTICRHYLCVRPLIVQWDCPCPLPPSLPLCSQECATMGSMNQESHVLTFPMFLRMHLLHPLDVLESQRFPGHKASAMA